MRASNSKNTLESDLLRIRNYFGLNDRTAFEHFSYLRLNEIKNILKDSELIIRRFKNHCDEEGYPSKSFKEKVKKHLKSIQ